MCIKPWVVSGCIAVGFWSAQCSAQGPSNDTAISRAPVASPARRLDLRAPKITEILSEQAIARALRATRDPDTLEEVEVEAGRYKAEPRSPVVPGGILSPFWALLHPTQAWRILAPLPPDQTSGVDNSPPDATDPYRAPTLPPR